ncbi:MAG: SPOR domain-containing protein [Pseudomonadota bacterium]
MSRVGQKSGSALRAALLAAGLGLACAGGALAQDFEAGLAAFRSGKMQAAHDIWLPLAEAGDPSAQFSLGKLYEKGDGPIPEDPAKAVAWYKLAAASGLPQAQNDLAMMYAQGRGGPVDLDQAVALWRQAAAQGYPWAQFNLGIALFRGQGAPPDQTAAVEWFRRAAEAGLAEAQFILGQLSQTGLVVVQSQRQALHWYRLAAAQGHRQAAEQAEILAQAGVTVESEPAPEADPAVEVAVDAATPPKPKPAAPVTAASETPTEAPAIPTTDRIEGDFHLWLASAESEDEAARIWQSTKARHPDALADQPAQIARQELDGASAFYRVMVGPLPSRQAAERACATLKAQDPSTFCMIRTN